MTATPTGRPLKVGIQLPEVEREVALARAASTWPAPIEDLGFDSRLGRRAPALSLAGPAAARAVGGLDAARGHRRDAPTRIELGPLVACTNFHNPALLAKQAATIDEISGGRFVLGLGAGWNETEFRAFGFPFDHRIDRFEEAFTIIRTLLREGAIDFDGRYYQARDCELLPRGPRPGGPPLMIGSIGPRMLRIDAAPRPTRGTPGTTTRTTGRTGVARLRDLVDDACRDGRPRPGRGRADRRRARPAARAGPAGSRVDTTQAAIPPLDGDPAALADALRAYAREGIGHVQLVLDPITIDSIRAVAPVLAELDRG